MAEIRPAGSREEREACARIMSSTEPWLTLRRGMAACLKTLEGPSKELYVAVEGGAVRGLILVNMGGAFFGYIQAVAVDEARRGSGLGRRLVAFAEERIFADSPNVFLCVSSFNTRAQKFYRELGYEKVGELEDYAVAGHSELLLRKTTGPWDGFRPRSAGR